MIASLCSISLLASAQLHETAWPADRSEELVTANDAEHPCISEEVYRMIEARCRANAEALGLSTERNGGTPPPLLSWPLQPGPSLSDCSYYSISAYVDQNTATGSIQDHNCGTNTYDGHRGTDIGIYPFGLYKMDNDHVQVIAAAPGILLDKADGGFDRNCATNNLPANYVIIQHADGSKALYWHMKKFSVTSLTIGSSVSTGDYLGVVGSSGSSTGPHLHFEVWAGSTNATRVDPYSGSCNTLNATSWWASQKPYREPAVTKASVHTTDIVVPGCPTTETPNEASVYEVPFQGPGLAPGYAKFYAFMRNETSGYSGTGTIYNPNGSVFNTWSYSSTSSYNNSWRGFSKLLPTTPGIYTFTVDYNGTNCSQDFEITTPVGMMESSIGGLRLYPNPAKDQLTLEMSGAEEGIYQLRIVNALGQTVSMQAAGLSSSSPKHNIAVNAFPAGVYLLQLEHGSERSALRFVVE